MNIVILDGFTLNPGDLSWKGFMQLGNVTVYEHTPTELTVERAKECEIILTNKTVLNKETIDLLPKLKYIGVLATGYNVVDARYAALKGIVVTNIPTYGTDSVAQYTFALLLQLCHHVKEHSDLVFNGKWSECRDFCFWNYPLVELSGKTMGIIGYGRIGKQVGSIARAFGMHLTVHDPKAQSFQEDECIQWLELNELLQVSDVVSLHCPLVESNKEIINRQALSKMKPTSFLINTSRGGLINDSDLTDALNYNKLAGAALDVLSSEPPEANNPLFKAKNCIITPHIAWASEEARSRLMNTAVQNLACYLKGNPINVVFE